MDHLKIKNIGIKMKIVSVILARGGSKEIPNKNIIDLCGKPLISYAISESLNSVSSETWVSTDCPKIRDVSELFGAKVLKRPTELAGDYSKSEESLIHFVENVSCDVVVFIQPTSPLISSKYINEGIDMIGSNDSVFSAYKEHWTPRWTKDISPDGWDINNRPMRQEVDYRYVENGAFYITTSHRLSRSNLRYSGAIGVVEMPRYDSIQVDTYDDLFMVESLMKIRNIKIGN
tara:strand:- start:7687 stop:8382 length:696 start_codon:yes stop_codon:yes gene_type:complete